MLFIMTRYFMLLSRIFVILGFYPIRDPAVSTISSRPYSNVLTGAYYILQRFVI